MDLVQVRVPAYLRLSRLVPGSRPRVSGSGQNELLGSHLPLGAAGHFPVGFHFYFLSITVHLASAS